MIQRRSAAGAELNRPENRYYHRTISAKKLVETGFSAVPRNSTLAAMIKLYRLPEVPLEPAAAAPPEGLVCLA